MEVPEETLMLKIKSMGRSMILAIQELLKPWRSMCGPVFMCMHVCTHSQNFEIVIKAV